MAGCRHVKTFDWAVTNNKEIYFSGFQEVSLACAHVHRWLLCPCIAYTAFNSCLIKFFIPLCFPYHIRTCPFTVLPLFQAKNSRTFQGLSRIFLRNFKDFSMTIYLTWIKMFVLNDTGLALWHSPKPHFNEIQKPSENENLKTCAHQT